MRVVCNIEGENVFELTGGDITFQAKAAVDVDGLGSAHGDPDYQDDTSLHQNGQALNADLDCYVVVPPQIINLVKGIVLGCQAYVLNIKNGQSSEAVVGDIGPHLKLGEISRSLAIALGIDPSPVSGGEFEHVIFYHLIPGKYAVVNGKQYSLQAT